MTRQEKGFSLLELMIVLAILGIIASLAIPGYVDYNIRAQVTEGLVLIRSPTMLVSEVYGASGVFPGSNAQANLPAPASISGSYVSQTEVLTGGQIRVTFGGKGHASIVGATLLLTPYTDNTGGNVRWQCGDSTITGATISPTAAAPGAGGTLDDDYRTSSCKN